MKKFLNIIRSILWIILIVIPTIIFEGLIGGLCYISIIGKKLAYKHFAHIKLILHPKNKVVAVKYDRHIALNTLYGIFGGFILVGIYYALAVVLYITIIGMPLGYMLFQIVKHVCAPFGSEILDPQEYSSTRDTNYDIKLLICRMYNNKDKEIKIKGRNRNAYDYLLTKIKSHMDEENSFIKVYKKYTSTRTIAGFIPLVVMLLIFYVFQHVLVALCAVLLSMFITVFVDNYFLSKLNNIFLFYFPDLFSYYLDKTDYDFKTGNLASNYLKIIQDLARK